MNLLSSVVLGIGGGAKHGRLMTWRMQLAAAFAAASVTR